MTRTAPTARAVFATLAGVATLELVVARISGGALAPQQGVGAGSFALALAAVLWGLRSVPALAGFAPRLGTTLPPALYGWWVLAAPFQGRPGWLGALLGLGVTGLLVTAACARGRALPGPRAALLAYAIALAGSWGRVALSESSWPPSSIGLAGLAAAGAVALGGRAAWLLPVAFVPHLQVERWEVEGPVPALPDVLLISVDTLRLDSARRMQVWSRLEADGVAYAAQAPSPWTLPSLASLLTGVEPARHGAVQTPGGLTPLPERFTTLAEFLAARGYDTVASVHSPFAEPHFGLRQGFARFRSETIRFWPTPAVPFGEGARPLAAAALAGLGLLPPHPSRAELRVADARDFAAARRDRPLFVWIHLLDPHIPYRHASELDLPLRERLLLSGAQYHHFAPRPPPRVLSLLRKGYDHEVDVVDRAVTQILDALEPGPHGRIVVFTSDHGEEFGEHAGWEHGHSFFQELLAVPLVIAGLPGLAPGEAGLVDVAPTLLRALGIPDSERGALDGRDLSTPGERVAYRSSHPLYGDLERRAVKRGPLKLIAHGSTLNLFDLRRDPDERRPLVGKHPALAELYRALPSTEPVHEPPPPLDPDTEAALRALGYVEPRGPAPRD